MRNQPKQNENFLYFSFSPRKPSKCNKSAQTLKNSGYESSLNCSIDHQSSDRSHSTLNNEIIIKVGLL
jgi:hypothetical protein